MKVIILAGGGGTRLFPLSRACYPKQFLKVTEDHSLLAQTVQRFLSLVKAEDIVIVTNKAYLHHVQTELLRDSQAILATRRPRAESEFVPWMCHLLAVHEAEAGPATVRSML